MILISAAAAVACRQADPLEGVVRETSLKVGHEMEIFPIEGGEIMLTVDLKSRDRSPWEAVVMSEEGWCTLSETSGRASSTITLSVTANVDGQNKPLAPRQTQVVFKSEGCEDVVLSVNQEGRLEGSMPAGVTRLGANYNVPEPGCVTLVVYEENEKNEKKVHYDYCYVIGDFSAWEPSAEYAMTRDQEKKCWWITFTDVELIAGMKFTVSIEGTQDLEEGVYIYTSEKINNKPSQTFVGLASGTNTVGLAVDMKFTVTEPDAQLKDPGAQPAQRRTVTETEVKKDLETVTTLTTHIQEEITVENSTYRQWFREKLRQWSYEYEEDEEDIIDEDVPLADAPRTGDISMLWAAISGLSLGGVAVLSIKRREED